jgi:DNA mismatch repair protein MutL
MHTLDTLTTTQLTAGSMITRPSAVVRELIDNAIDAQARHITVYLDNHGKIAVHDDGIGMHIDDLAQAFQPHTTSKIRRYDDLLTLSTLGFRGDALAAIAAVARVTCISRTATCPSAHELRIAGGEVHDIRPCAGQVGTYISVERLYHTIPHRRNFWRQPHTERQHIIDVCTHYALVYPEVCIRVEYDTQTVLCTQGSGSTDTTIHDIWPHRIFTRSTAYTHDGAGALHACIGAERTASRRQQFVAINRRPIAVRGFIAHVIDEVLPPVQGHYATVVLHFTLPASSIDINVRSNKDELGIRTPSSIARLLYDAIRHPTPMPDMPSTVRQALPHLTLIGTYTHWSLWQSIEGLVVMDAANVMRACGITQLDAGKPCVPPYPLTLGASRVFRAHAAEWEQLGIHLTELHDEHLCVTRLPYRANSNAIAHAVAACVQTIRRGGTFAMGIGHFLDPHWLYEQLTHLPDPWSHHAIFMIGHHRIATALRMPHTPTEAPDQSPRSQAQSAPD